MGVPSINTDFTLGGASPFSRPDVWDTITISGKSWTGKFEIRGARKSYKWDQKDGAGLEGAYLTYRGKAITPFHIYFYVWTDDIYAAWDSFSKLFNYSGVKPPGPLPPPCELPRRSAAMRQEPPPLPPRGVRAPDAPRGSPRHEP